MVVSVNSQDITWEKSYGGVNGDYLMDAVPTADYGFLLAGSSVSDKTGNKNEKTRGNLDYWLWKMDEFGTLEWQKTMGGSGADMLSCIVTTRDGGFLLAGSSTSPKGGEKKQKGFGMEDYWIIKLNADGSEQWQNTIGGIGSDKIESAIELPSGGYILAGTSSSPKSVIKKQTSYGNSDYWIVKLEPEGNISWETTVGGNYLDIPVAVATSKNNDIYVLGYSNSDEGPGKLEESLGQGDYWLLKMDDKGTVLWEKAYGGEKDDKPTAMIALREGGLLLGGVSNSENSGNKQASNQKGADFWVLSINEEGSIEREDTYNIGQFDILSSLVENEDGTVLIGGYARTEKLGKKSVDKKGINDYVAIKIDKKGKVLWKQEVGSNGDEMLSKLFKSRDGGYILAGTSNGNLSRNKNTGQGKHDFWLVKLGDEDNKENKVASIVEAYPNPTSGFANIIITEAFSTGQAFLYDIQGKLLQQYKLTSRTLPINLSSLPVGMYLVNIDTDTVDGSVKILRKD